MKKMHIGAADIPQLEKEKKTIEKLTVLEPGSEQSIYRLLFEQEDKGDQHEQ